MSYKFQRNLQEAMQIDQQIMQLAAYEVSKGMLLDISTPEEMFEFQRNIKNKFNSFKMGIKCSEYTLEELEDLVINQYGPYIKNKEHKNFSDYIEDIGNSSMKEKDDHPQGQTIQPEDLMRFLFQGAFDNFPVENEMKEIKDENIKDEKGKNKNDGKKRKDSKREKDN